MKNKRQEIYRGLHGDSILKGFREFNVTLDDAGFGLCAPPSFGCLRIKKTKNSMVRVRERTIPTERPPLVGEVIANLCG
jgi:hypothetical protein